MSKATLMTTGFLAVLLAFTASNLAEEPKALPKLFGMPLGVVQEEALKLVKQAELKYETSQRVSYKGPHSGIPGGWIKYRGTVNPVPGPSTMTVHFVERQVYKVSVSLEDLTVAGWKRIQAKLEEKYGMNEATRSKRSTYERKNDNVHVSASYESLGSEGVVTITYSDAKKIKELDERIRERIRKRRQRNDGVPLNDNL